VPFSNREEIEHRNDQHAKRPGKRANTTLGQAWHAAVRA
jgi:hypothetical protein